MIIQDIGNDRRLVYTPEPDTDYKSIGVEFGICDKDGNPASGLSVASRNYTNSYGVQMKSWVLTGHTVTLVVVPDHVSGVIDNKTMANALNSFNKSVYKYDRYIFTGKFYSSSGPNTVTDHEGRRFNMSFGNIKDLRGIYDIMANVGANNGKMYEPLIMRYVTAMRALRNGPIKAIGYFDLSEYISIIGDDRRYMFEGHAAMSAAKIVMKVADGGCTVRVASVDRETGQANIEIDGITVVDNAKVRSMKPHVIISTAPLSIRPDMPFKSVRVTFGKLPLFLTPIISLPDAWESLAGGIDLLKANIY